MGFLDALRGRAKPVTPELDALLLLPAAADVLDADLGFTPSGTGSVCFRALEGRSFREILYDARDWLNQDLENAAQAEIADDSYGFTWMTVRRAGTQFQLLIDELHQVSFKLTEAGNHEYELTLP
jgi:hypothetical protein